MTNPKDLHILHVLASLQGGAAQHVLHLSRGLIKAGATVSLAAPTDDAALKLQFDFSGCLLRDAALNRTWPAKPVRQLKKLYRQEPFTHIHLHGMRAAYLGRSAWRSGDAPVVYTVHGYHPPHYASPWRRSLANRFENRLEPHTSAYIAVSPSTQKALCAAVPNAAEKCRIIANAIPSLRLSDDEARLARKKIRREAEVNEHQFVIGTLARLQWQKGLDLLLQTHKTLLDQGRQQVLIIAGDGPDREKLQNQCRELGIEETTRFLGHRDNAHHVYYALDVFALPSLWEGLPLSVLEAWDAGVPVVVSDVPGSRDIVTHEENGLCAPRDTEAFARAIQQLRNNDNLRQTLIQQAQQHFDEACSVEHMVGETLQVYLSISANRD